MVELFGISGIDAQLQPQISMFGDRTQIFYMKINQQDNKSSPVALSMKVIKTGSGPWLRTPEAVWLKLNLGKPNRLMTRMTSILLKLP